MGESTLGNVHEVVQDGQGGVGGGCVGVGRGPNCNYRDMNSPSGRGSNSMGGTFNKSLIW